MPGHWTLHKKHGWARFLENSCPEGGYEKRGRNVICRSGLNCLFAPQDQRRGRFRITEKTAERLTITRGQTLPLSEGGLASTGLEFRQGRGLNPGQLLDLFSGESERFSG
jgi:hypothetical protein